MAIPSITVAEGLGIFSGVVDNFISSLARVDLLVVLLSPSGVAKAHGMGPRGWLRTSLIYGGWLWRGNYGGATMEGDYGG